MLLTSGWETARACYLEPGTGSTLSQIRNLIPTHYNREETIMKSKAIFYHAGCPVCVAAEQSVATALDPSKYDVEHVHLGTSKERVKEAEAAGVKSVPALVMNGAAFHINFGAGIEALR
jgi:glutaredoxin